MVFQPLGAGLGPMFSIVGWWLAGWLAGWWLAGVKEDRAVSLRAIGRSRPTSTNEERPVSHGPLD